MAELRRLLAELTQVDLEVGLVREELVDALEVVVAADHVELRPETVEEVVRLCGKTKVAQTSASWLS